MKVLLIMQRELNVGGIESYCYELIKSNLMDNKRVIWLCDKGKKIADAYEDLKDLADFEMKEVDTHGLRWISFPELDFQTNDEVVYICFSLFDYFRGLDFQKRYSKSCKIFKVLYLVPHFKGQSILLEENMVVLRKRIAKLSAGIYSLLDKSHSVLYFSNRHYEAIENNYGIRLQNKQRICSFSKRPEFILDEVRKRYHAEKLRIISAGRIDFPHKGYLLGLIDAFARFKIEYPSMELYIFGDGPDVNGLLKKIESLEEGIRKDIHYHCSVSKDVLISEMRKSNLCVSVAGCANIAARNGVLTLPARHYDYSCEVYGFIPDSLGKTTCSEPGMPLDGFLMELLLNMSYETYFNKCKKSYESYEYSEVDNDFYFSYDCKTPSFSRMICFRVKLILFLYKIKSVITRDKYRT